MPTCIFGLLPIPDAVPLTPNDELFLDHRRLAYHTAIRWAHHYLFLGGTDLALSADANEAAQGITRLRGWRFVVNFDNLVWEYVNGEDGARRERLAKAYHEITGSDIVQRSLDLIRIKVGH
jgi:hypothetical protein